MKQRRLWGGGKLKRHFIQLRRKILFPLLIWALIPSVNVYAADLLIPNNRIKDNEISRFFVVSVGINNYIDSYWPTLKWPASDATRVSDQIAKGTEYQRVNRLFVNESATLAEINQVLDDITAKVQKNDAVLLYISGHGTLAQTDSGEFERYVVLHDTLQNRLIDTGLPQSKLRHWLNHLKARKKMIIFATCHSGEGKSRLPPKVKELIRMQKGKTIRLSDVSEGALVLAAAAKGETASESDELNGDIYTHYLLEGVRVNDRNKDGVVSALEAHDYARDRTWVYTHGKQRPTAYAKLIGDADMPLRGKASSDGLPILEAYDKNLDGFFVQVDNQVKGRLPTAFSLDPKGSTVALLAPEGNKTLASYRVKLNMGQAISLDKVMNQRPMSVGIHIQNINWSGDEWKKVAGGQSSNNIEGKIGLQFGELIFGISLNSPLKESGSLRSQSIKSSVSLHSLFFNSRYQHKILSNIFFAQLELGRERLDLKLEGVAGETANYSDTSLSYGMAIGGQLHLFSDAYLSFEAGTRQAEWDYGDIGNIPGRRTWIGIGFDYQIGWHARTVR